MRVLRGMDPEALGRIAEVVLPVIEPLPAELAAIVADLQREGLLA